MEAHPRALLRRELGLKAAVNCPPIDVTKYIRSLECNEADKIQVGENEDNFVEEIPLYDVKFCPIQYHPHFLAASDELGYLSIINTKKGEGDSEKVILKHQCHKNALFSMDWSPFKDGTIATCSGDNTVKIWDIQKNFQDNTTFRGHERTVKAVKFHPTSQDCLCSGGRDGNIIFWDARIGASAAASNVIRKAHGSKRSKDSEAVSVTDILFYDDNTVISSGATDGCIKFWDMRKTYSGLKNMIPVSTIEWPKYVRNGKGYVSMCLDQQNNLYGCALQQIFKFNLSTTIGMSEPATFLVPYKLNYYVKVNISRDGRFLICGSSSSESYIWDTFDPSPDAFVYLNSDSQSSCIAVFSPEDTFKVVTGGDDGRIQIWRPNVSKVSAEENDLNDHEMTKGIDRAHHKSLQDVPDEDSVRHLNQQQIDTNERVSEVAKMFLKFKPNDLNPTNGLFLSNLLSNNCRDHGGRNGIADLERDEYDLLLNYSLVNKLNISNDSPNVGGSPGNGNGKSVKTPRQKKESGQKTPKTPRVKPVVWKDGLKQTKLNFKVKPKSPAKIKRRKGGSDSESDDVSSDSSFTFSPLAKKLCHRLISK